MATFRPLGVPRTIESVMNTIAGKREKKNEKLTSKDPATRHTEMIRIIKSDENEIRKITKRIRFIFSGYNKDRVAMSIDWV